MLITTRNANIAPQGATYSRAARVLAEQTLESQDSFLSDNFSNARNWNSDQLQLVVRDNAQSALSFLAKSSDATDTEKTIAEVALKATQDVPAKMANQANSAALQAIGAQIPGPAGLVIARSAMQAQEQLKGLDASAHADSLGRVLESFSEMQAFNDVSRALAAKGMEVSGDASAVRNQRLDILNQVMTAESTPNPMGEMGEFKILKTPRGIGRTRWLKEYGIDMSKMAMEGKLGPFFGREAEGLRAGVILTRKTKNNAVFVGPAGVGKTAVAEKMALDALNDASHPLNGKTIVQLDLAAMVAGTKYRGMFEERLKGVIEECRERKDIVLFIDELHTMMGAGSGEKSPMDASNILKPALARGDLQVIGSTTQDEYEKHILKDPAMARRFAPITIDETSTEDTVKILGVLKESFQNFHDLTVPDALLAEIVDKADKGQPERYFPDKAIDLLDEAMSSARVAGDKTLTVDHVNKALGFMQKGAEALARYGRDLTRLATDGKLGPFTGRAEETRAMERTLLRAGKNNPVLVGDGGVGKTAIVEKLAVDMLDENHVLHGKRLVELSMTELVAGTGGRGSFEERMKLVLEAAKRDPNVVLFIDEIHTVMGAGGNGGAMDAANMLKPALARGELTLIGATTLDEYRNYIMRDPALERRFDPVFVDELKGNEALEVLNAVAPKYEKHHGVKMPRDLMTTLMEKAHAALPSRKQPDKGLDVLDMCLSEAALQGLDTVTVEVIDLVCEELKKKEAALRG